MESIRRAAPNKFHPDEVLVLFKEHAVRDTIIGSSAKLSEMHDKITRSSLAGIRMFPPDYLRSDFKVLEEYGRRLRGIHGRGTKYHVKFDDGDRALYLNVRKENDVGWSRADVDFARVWVKRLKKEEADKMNIHFNRSVSVSSANLAPLGGSGGRDRGRAASASATPWPSASPSKGTPGPNGQTRSTVWTGSAGLNE